MLICSDAAKHLYLCHNTTLPLNVEKISLMATSQICLVNSSNSEYLVDICNLYLLETDGTNIVAKHWYLQSDTRVLALGMLKMCVGGSAWATCRVPRERWHVTRWYGDNQSAPVTRTRQYGYDAMLPVISEIYHTTSGKCRDSHGISRCGASMFGHMVILSERMNLIICQWSPGVGLASETKNGFSLFPWNRKISQLLD